MSSTPRTIDDAHTQLHTAGWSVGDIETLDLAGRRVWHVYSHRGEQRVLARASTQAEAWAEVRRMVECMDG